VKPLIAGIAVVCILHMLAALGIVGYLAGTDRLSRDRLMQVKDIFTPSLTDEADALKKAEQDAAQAQAIAARVELTSGKTSPTSASQRLAEERQKHEITLRQLERTRQEVESLRANLQQAQSRLEQRNAQLEADKKAFEQRVADLEQRHNDEGFRKALSLYESLPAKQVKQMFLTMHSQSQTDQIVSYLESMQPRKAAAILKEFKSETESQLATELTRRLRDRGSLLKPDAETAG
jgi:flagellar motility protein MotE (MotC chaperone)